MPGIGGGALREWRRSRGWDVPEMARKLRRAAREAGVTIATHAGLVRMIYAWERGDHKLTERYRLLYARVLGTEPDQLARGPAGDRAGNDLALLAAPSLSLSMSAEEGNVDRRQFGLAAMGLLGSTLMPALGQVQGPVAPELVDYFGSQLAGHYSADRLLGPTRLIPTAVSQYELLCNLANAASDRLRRNLWSLATGYAAFVGWLYQDAGDLKTSAHWLDVMIERSHRSQDVQLVCFALHNKAMLHADMHDGRGVLDQTDAALQQRAHLCPKVQVLLLQQAAHGTSLAADDDAGDWCDRLLDGAVGLLDAIDDHYPWGGSCQTPRYVDVQRATIYTRLGRAREALKLWEQIIPGIPASSRRDLGVFRARQAQALADAGEPESQFHPDGDGFVTV